MAFTVINTPELLVRYGFSIRQSTTWGLYYYFHPLNGLSLYLHINKPDFRTDAEFAAKRFRWTFETPGGGAGDGAGYYYVKQSQGLKLPYYTSADDAQHAFNAYNSFISSRAAPAPAPSSAAAPVNVRQAGQKRPRNNNQTVNTRATQVPKRNGNKNVGQAIAAAQPRNWSEKCGANGRDERHVTALIHNVEANTFLIGTENIWAKNSSGQEIGLIQFTDFMNGEQLDYYHYIKYILSVLTSIGINGTDKFGPPPPINTMQPVTEDLINDIYNKIASSIHYSNNTIRYHVKKIQKTPLGCSEFIIMQKRTWGRKLGFPKGAVETVDIASNNEDETLKNAAIREVREEVRSILLNPVILGTIQSGNRTSNVCYFTVDNVTARSIIEGFNARQISSELFNVEFVDCNYLLTNFGDFNAYSQQIINDMTGTESITFRDIEEVTEIKGRLFGICRRRGGKRQTRKSRHNKRRKTRSRK